jgi:predicted nucleotidyltransferase
MVTRAMQTIAERIRRDRKRWEEQRRRICSELSELLLQLGPRHGLSRAILFGSAVWGDFDDRSDIDLLVWGATASEEQEIASQLWQRVGRPVHVVRAEQAPSGLLERVLAEGEELRVC